MTQETRELRNMVDGKTGLTHREGTLRNLNHPHRPRTPADIEIFLNGYWVRAITEYEPPPALADDPDFEAIEMALEADDKETDSDKESSNARLTAFMGRALAVIEGLEPLALEGLRALQAQHDAQTPKPLPMTLPTGTHRVSQEHRRKILEQFGHEIFRKLDQERPKTNLWIVASYPVLEAAGLERLLHQETPFSIATLFGIPVAVCECNTLRLVWAFDSQQALKAIHNDIRKNVNLLDEAFAVTLHLPIKDD